MVFRDVVSGAGYRANPLAWITQNFRAGSWIVNNNLYYVNLELYLKFKQNGNRGKA